MPEWVQAILLGAGTMVGAVTFWFTEIHEPSVTPAPLTISPALEAIGRQGGQLLVRASLNIENRSAYRVYVPAFWYTVRGYCFRPRALSPDSYETALRGWREGGVQSRFNEGARGELLVAGRPSPRKDSYFDPGSERHYEELFLVPAGPYGALRMEVHYMVAKDVSEIDTTRWALAGHDVREEVFISTRRTETAPGAFAWTRTTSEPYNKTLHRDWRERAGAAWGWSHASLSLWPSPNGASPASAGGAVAGPAAAACGA
jgi:hypothetical protein